MTVDLLIVVRQGEDNYLVETQSNTAGVGASSIEDMV